MYKCYYLLVWCEDSGCWWQADGVRGTVVGPRLSMLKGRPATILRARRGPWWCRTNGGSPVSQAFGCTGK